MRSQFVRIAIFATAALTAIACSDDKRDLLAPKSPDNLIIKDPGFGVFRPVLPNPEDFVEITAGDYHTCARKNNGNVYCWGQEGGPLYIATVMQTPKLIFQGATTVDAGREHTCSLISSGAAYCWGGGNQGQLGVASGQYITYNGPQAVTGPVDPNNPYGPALPAIAFTSLSAGGRSTCGTAASGVWCWGELGNSPNFSTPIAAPFLTSSYNGMTSVTLGYQHACGYLSWATLAYCWGANNVGQAGVDATSMQWWAFPGTTVVQFAASNGLGSAVARVSAGGSFTCADQLAGTVQCFGTEAEGELGNGTSGWGLSTTVPQTVGNGQALHGVSAGVQHACALDANNQAWCWGWGLYGQLGQGSSVSVAATPQQVTGARAYRAIAAGYRHTCAIGTDNHIYCWGQNNYRQLGTWIVDVNGNVVTNGYSPNPVLTM